MHTVKSKDGTVIAFERSGEGDRTLILVAGALSDRSGGTRLAKLLAPHFTVINYDRRGRGDSADTKPYSVQREIEDIAALIDHAGEPVYLFGSSSGAALALHAASKLGSKVEKAVLFEPPFIVDDSREPVLDMAKRTNELIAEGKRSEAVEYFMTVAVGVPVEHVAQMKQSPMWAGLEAISHTLPYDAAVMGDTLSGKPLKKEMWAAADMPILVIDGGNSDQWLRNASKALAEVLSNAEHRTLEGHDHSATFMAPQVFVPILVEFLSDSKAGE